MVKAKILLLLKPKFLPIILVTVVIIVAIGIITYSSSSKTQNVSQETNIPTQNISHNINNPTRHCDPNISTNNTGWILWKKDQQLSFSDYRGTPDYNVSDTACTTTYLSLPQTTGLSIPNSSEFYFANVTVKTYFRPYDSWMKTESPPLDTMQQNKLLKHEQGHFDLAEKYAEKMETEMMSAVKGQKFPLDSSDNNIILAEIQKVADSKFIPIRNNLLQEWHQYESDYDSNTNNGTIDDVQSQYNHEFDKLRVNDTQR